MSVTKVSTFPFSALSRPYTVPDVGRRVLMSLVYVARAVESNAISVVGIWTMAVPTAVESVSAVVTSVVVA